MSRTDMQIKHNAACVNNDLCMVSVFPTMLELLADRIAEKRAYRDEIKELRHTVAIEAASFKAMTGDGDNQP